jgi:hypothetical protein
MREARTSTKNFQPETNSTENYIILDFISNLFLCGLTATFRYQTVAPVADIWLIKINLPDYLSCPGAHHSPPFITPGNIQEIYF